MDNSARGIVTATLMLHSNLLQALVRKAVAQRRDAGPPLHIAQ